MATIPTITWGKAALKPLCYFFIGYFIFWITPTALKKQILLNKCSLGVVSTLQSQQPFSNSSLCGFNAHISLCCVAGLLTWVKSQFTCCEHILIFHPSTSILTVWVFTSSSPKSVVSWLFCMHFSVFLHLHFSCSSGQTQSIWVQPSCSGCTLMPVCNACSLFLSATLFWRGTSLCCLRDCVYGDRSAVLAGWYVDGSPEAQQKYKHHQFYYLLFFLNKWAHLSTQQTVGRGADFGLKTVKKTHWIYTEVLVFWIIIRQSKIVLFLFRFLPTNSYFVVTFYISV